MKKVILIGCVLMAAVFANAQPAASDETSLVVIPARYTVVQFSFDVARLRSLYLVAYDRGVKAESARLHAWDNRKSDWVQIEESALSNGSLFQVRPAHVIVVGDEATVPASVAAAAAGSGASKRIESLNIKDLVNGFDASMHFKPSEWKWLAGRYDLKLKDQNELRRRYGRYGTPGSTTAAPISPALKGPSAEVPMPAPEETDLLPVGAPPAAVMPHAAANDRPSIVIGGTDAAPVPASDVKPAAPVAPLPENK